MRMIKPIAYLGIGAAVAVLLLGVGGCAAYLPPGAGVYGGVGVNYYSPLYYNGFVVYYDNLGSPYYYLDGRINYVPRSYPYYGNLVIHYRRYRPEYHRWYRNTGHRYHDYRHPHYGTAYPRHHEWHRPAPVRARPPAVHHYQTQPSYKHRGSSAPPHDGSWQGRRSAPHTTRQHGRYTGRGGPIPPSQAGPARATATRSPPPHGRGAAIGEGAQ